MSPPTLSPEPRATRRPIQTGSAATSEHVLGVMIELGDVLTQG